ncbi:uncharacterized protein KY384_008790 [Bacidia gigantensis]|uniref:uncharacterized protein n=1 Tax=Bacidia gigantensis TaxID=2732470 RepID=UPI001D0579BD|nr:uncharacterized protein KY384_008790 [Bacidia gigantensis]KAG8526589.1 hypothetical protein KY384_008790 [Bacidia gigantensis]
MLHPTRLPHRLRENNPRGEEGKGSVAFSCLSTGVYGYPATEAAEVAIKEVRRWLEGEGKGKLERVVFCVFEAKDERAYREWLPRVFPPAPEDSPERESTKGQGEGEDTKQEAVEESAVLVPQNEDGGEEPSPKKAKTEAQSQDTAAAKDEWEAVEKPHTPIPVEQAMDKSQEMSEEGEKVEPESLGDSDGEKVERPKEEEKGGFEIVDPMGKAEEEKAVGVNTLMKDW